MSILTLQLKMPSLIYKGDVGSRLIIDTENHSIAVTTVITIGLKKPSGAFTTITPAAGEIDYTTGTITHGAVLGELDEAGEYRVQVHGVFSDGDDLKSNVDTFIVYEPIS